MIIKMMNEEERMVARQSQELAPRICAMGWSETDGLKQRGLMMFLLHVGSFSRLTKALIWISKNEEISVMGKIRSSMERSEEFLNAQIRVNLGILQVFVELM